MYTGIYETHSTIPNAFCDDALLLLYVSKANYLPYDCTGPYSEARLLSYDQLQIHPRCLSFLVVQLFFLQTINVESRRTASHRVESSRVESSRVRALYIARSYARKSHREASSLGSRTSCASRGYCGVAMRKNAINRRSNNDNGKKIIPRGRFPLSSFFFFFS